MEPRLSSSKKWTPLPEELLSQIQSVFEESFSKELGDAHIEVMGRIYPQELLLKISLLSASRLKQPGFELSISYDAKKDNVLKLVHLGLDALAGLFENYFAAEDDADFPRIWEKVTFEKREIFVQFSTENTRLEAEADALLGTSSEGLVHEDSSAEEQLQNLKGHLGLSDDDDEEGHPLPKKRH